MSAVEETIRIDPSNSRFLDGIRRRCRKLWMAALDRGPEDFVRDDEERIMLPVSLVDRLMKQNNGGGYHEGDKNLKAVIIGCTITLLCGFIIGGWVLSNRVSALEAKFEVWQQWAQAQITAAEKRIDRLEQTR